VEPSPLGRGILHVDAYDNVGEDRYEFMDRVGSEFAARTGRPFRQINNLIPAGDERALQSTLDLYARADLILTGRLHGCIIGSAMGRRVLAVSGDHKIEAFMRAAGLADWVLGLEDVGQLADRLDSLETQARPLEFLEAARAANRAVAADVTAAMPPH
jgi:polysaccharide pyruvyl transferase WcaK-like protein